MTIDGLSASLCAIGSVSSDVVNLPRVNNVSQVINFGDGVRAAMPADLQRRYTVCV